MVLELKVPFSEKKMATKFLRFLKINHCPSHISKETDCRETMEYYASIEIFQRFINSFYDNEDGNEEEYEEDDDVGRLFDWLSDIKGCLEKIYQTFELHVPYSHRDVLLKLYNMDIDSIEKRKESIHEDDIQKMMEDYKNISLSYSSFSILGENNCVIDNDSDTIIFTEKKAIEELILSTTDEELFENFNHDDLMDWGIEMHLISVREYQYVVTAGPRYINIDSKELINHIIECGVSPYIVHKIILGLRSDFTFIQRIDNLIEKSSPTTEELLEQLSETDEEFPIVYHVSQEYLEDVLYDMEKIGIIKGETRITYSKDS